MKCLYFLYVETYGPLCISIDPLEASDFRVHTRRTRRFGHIFDAFGLNAASVQPANVLQTGKQQQRNHIPPIPSGGNLPHIPSCELKEGKIGPN